MREFVSWLTIWALPGLVLGEYVFKPDMSPVLKVICSCWAGLMLVPVAILQAGLS